jgi:plastocyanin
MRTPLPFLALVLLAACGDDGGDGHDHDAAATHDASAIDALVPDADPTAPDAPAAPDAAPSAVVEVSCSGATIAVTVTAPSFAYVFTPDDGAPADQYTIAVDDIVQFTMPGSHDATSGPPNAPDGQFATGFGQTKCFQFTATGSYPFHCTPHDFDATLIVE